MVTEPLVHGRNSSCSPLKIHNNENGNEEKLSGDVTACFILSFFILRHVLRDKSKPTPRIS